MTKEDNRVHPYPIRLTRELREQLETLAKANGRSLNAEIVIRLDESLLKDGDTIISTNVLTVEDVRQIALEVIREELAKSGKG